MITAAILILALVEAIGMWRSRLLYVRIHDDSRKFWDSRDDAYKAGYTAGKIARLVEGSTSEAKE